jgi:hypothetical protein
MTQWPKSVDAEKAMRNWDSLLQSESNPAAKSLTPSASPSTSSKSSQATSAMNSQSTASPGAAPGAGV